MGENSSENRWPGESSTAYSEVFTMAPPVCGLQKAGQLTEEQLKQFFDKGFVVVDALFDTNTLEACRQDIEEEVEKLAKKLYKAKKVTSLYEDLGFFERLTALEKEFPGASVVLHKLGTMPKAVCDLWSDERLLNVVEQLLGTPEIQGSPVWNLRTKTPNNAAAVVPWHQDSAYFDQDAYKQMIVTAWIPLLDATKQNGCMQVVSGGHRTGRVAKHQCCHGGTWYVMLEDEEMEKTLDVDLSKDVVTCPIPYGGMLLFSNALPHRSLPNVSDHIRWSLDLRWQKHGLPAGIFGLKDGVRLRSRDPSFREIDWATFNAVDRTAEQFRFVDTENTDFDTTIQGPWMKQWEIVHMNIHTDAFAAAMDKPQQMPSIVG